VDAAVRVKLAVPVPDRASTPPATVAPSNNQMPAGPATPKRLPPDDVAEMNDADPLPVAALLASSRSTG
jgi:hypothetical protein